MVSAIAAKCSLNLFDLGSVLRARLVSSWAFPFNLLSFPSFPSMGIILQFPDKAFLYMIICYRCHVTNPSVSRTMAQPCPGSSQDLGHHQGVLQLQDGHRSDYNLPDNIWCF